ncbi:DUF1837 domain-containing protein [Rufibacter sediminis]
MDAFLKEVKKEVAVNGTKAKVHCYLINFDGDHSPRVADFAAFISHRLLDYCIPRSEIQKAKDLDSKNNTTSSVVKLNKIARDLLSSLDKSGEGGELMLYLLTQEYLKMPQLLCKMPLKTSSEMHIHGVDGIHVKYDDTSGGLALYWGESKMHKSITSAVSDCFKSVGKYLVSTGGSGTPYQREIQLITSNLDLIDEELEEAILDYLNKDSTNYNKVKNCAVCMLGFDYDMYPSGPNIKQIGDLLKEASLAINSWVESISKKLIKSPPLHSFDIELFLIPFPKVDEFRKVFLKEIGLK